jgi:hypothetical protein
MQAEVVARTTTSEPGTPDFALLRVPGAVDVPTLGFTTSVRKLDSVVSAGFPALIVLNDQNMNLLLRGDLSAMPDLAITSGEISVIQTLNGGLPVVAHTAVISSGNSGGPLVDRCGRVVGINTFINVDAQEVGHVSYAIAADSLADFLGQNGVDITPSAQRCDVDAVAQAEPVTDPATAEEPAEDEQAVDEPAVEDEPTADEPAADEPPAVEDEPAADEPAADTPAADEPAADEPAADTPAADEPAADEPATDAPATDAPAEDTPASDQPADAPAGDAPADESE